MKHEWKKMEKQFYLPSDKPELVSVPKLNFFTIKGKGNPNDEFFSEYIKILYSLSYGVKMSSKRGETLDGYFDYTVYPLEGLWSLNNDGIKSFKDQIDKNELVFKLMIRQPDFVQKDFALEILDFTKKKKPHDLLEQVRFEEIIEGDCIQMLHIGSYDNEPESFKLMEQFAARENVKRVSKTHREIYLSDARKVSTEKLKTVLRFGIEK